MYSSLILDLCLMRFLFDESADFRLAAFLRDLGHDVEAVARDYPQALTDREVLAIARREGRVIVANDRDFGELVFRQRLPHAGVILLRLETGGLSAKQVWLQRIVNEYADRLDQFIVVTERGVRIRSTP